MKEHATAVLIITPQGIPLVWDPKKPAPVFWKLPGGRSYPAETAEECASREVEEKVGVLLSPADLKATYQEDRGNHIFTFFRVELPVLPRLKKRGDTGEEIGVFTPSEILAKRDFFPNHRKVVEGVFATP